MPPVDAHARQIFGGRFLPLEEAGAGGMATVYRARDEQTGRDVAFKVSHDRDPVSRERFTQEAALLAELSHPAIVRYVAHGTTHDGDLFLAMEWLAGETLEDRLTRGRVPMLEAARLGARVAGALALAHAQGVIHRDLKPANLYLPGGDVSAVKLLDFGVARRTFETKRVTEVGAALGTPMYMSPEQARGDRELDARADLFSFGCVLFECLAGTPPFVGDTPAAVLSKICLAEPPRLSSMCSDVPAALERIVDSLLAKDPALRPPGAAVVAEQLAVIADELAGAGAATAGSLGLRAVGEQRVVSVMMVRPRPLESGGGMAAPDLLRTWQGRSKTPLEGTSGAFEQRQLDDLRLAVATFGGRVERFLDDTVVVTLIGRGAPTDQAAQAARCALAVREVLPPACIAVSTGRAIVGSELPLGTVLDDAAALLAVAPAGSIIVDRVTADLVEARFELRAGPPHQLLFEKGLKEAPRTLLGKETPCVGRERELGALVGIFEEAVSEPAARVMLVTAAPGGGKSRVRHELVERVQSRGEPFELLIGQGDPLRQGAPFALLGPALRNAVGISGNEPALVQQKRLLAHVVRHVAADRAPAVAAFLGEICGVPFPDTDAPALAAARKDPRLMADRTLGAWLDFIGAVTATGPLLLILEDMHWGDLPSVQFVDAALRLCRDKPFVVVAFGRPEVDEKFSDLWAERDLQRISLAPLTSRACGRLARAVLTDLDDARMSWIVERSDGNPFVLEELLRAAAAGSLVGEGVVLPESVIGMVQARFDALGPEAKRILRAASLYGQSFRGGGVAALLGEAEAAGLGAWLEVLASREIVFPRNAGSGAPAGDQEYVWRHALLRDAAYDLLPAEARKLGHRGAGEWLEAQGERDAITLVEHFERGEVLSKAAHWCRFAAVQALEANDLAATIARAARGVRCGASGETLGHLHLYAAQARFWRGEYRAAEDEARDSYALLDGAMRFAATAEIIAALGQQARYDEVASFLEEVSATTPEHAATSQRLTSVLRAADFMMVAGRYEVAQQALAQVESLGDRLEVQVVANICDLRAKLACHAGDSAAGVAGFKDALRLFESLGHERKACELLVNVGLAIGEVGFLAEAEDSLRRALTMCERLGIVEFVGTYAMLNLCLVLAQRGDIAGACAIGQQTVAVARKQGDLRAEGGARTYLSAATFAAGQLDQAEEHARAAVQLLSSVPSLLPMAIAALARVLLASGRVDEALELASRAHDLLGSAGGVEDGEAAIRLVYAEALEAAANRAAAIAAIREACARLTERAAAIVDPEWRSSFLSNIREHARTNELAASWLGA